MEKKSALTNTLVSVFPSFAGKRAWEDRLTFPGCKY